MIERILIVDDDAALSRSLQLQLGAKGIAADVAGTAAGGIVAVETEAPDLVLLDINLPDGDGLSVMKQIVKQCPDVPVVIVTARQDMAATIKAMQSGAFDYIRKPFDIDDVMLVIEKLGRRGPQSKTGGTTAGDAAPPRELVGAAPKMLDVLKQVGLLSRSRVSVLIRGESGTGKELVARALHEASCPCEPFLAINCSAVVPTLMESELFGHEKGAFTGADRKKIGKLEFAGKGTVFFDEIGDMEIDLQAKLLRVLQEKEFERVGGTEALTFKARVVCATHRNLKVMVADRKFREDLLYRIAVSELELPPLRERPGDIRLLVQHFLAKLGTELHKRVDNVDGVAMRELNKYHWPGNVRELENVLARAVALSRSSTLVADDFALPNKSVAGGASVENAGVSLADAEKIHIEKVLSSTGWNITRTAQLLEISPTTLRKKISDYALQKR